MTDADVIAAIRKSHLKANITDPYIDEQFWDEAWVDPGGPWFAPGPYVRLPVRREGERLIIRVYAPERLRKRLAKAWRPV
jgi:hypothetical protein